MARCLLVSFAGYPVMASSLFPDNGLASLAGTLLAAGHEVKVLDYNTVQTLGRAVPAACTRELAELLPALAGGPSSAQIEALLAVEHRLSGELERVTGEIAEEIAEEVAARRCDLVGFKLWSGDGLLASVRIARHLRRRFPRLTLAGGGPAVLYSEEVLLEQWPVFDLLVDGEGEQALLGLAEHLGGRRSLEEVPNLILPGADGARRTGRLLLQDLDRLAPPCYQPEVYPALAGDQQIRLFIIDESRGCPMGCGFCIHGDASGNRWRMKSTERVLAELAALGELHRAEAFRFGGSYTPARFFDAFAAEARARSGGLQFCGFAHPQGLHLEHLAGLAEAGCQALFFGVESFHPDELALMGKTLKPQRVRGAVEACLEVGIVPIVSLVFPAPGQTPASRAHNLEQAVALCAGQEAVVQTQFPGLLPRTPWWLDRARHGFELQVSEAEYRRRLATYKIRHLVPPSLWEPLPYTLDGNDFAAFAAANAAFQRQLSAEGVVVNISDEVVLMARRLGTGLGALRDRMRALFFTLDVPAISRFVAEMNAALERRP